MKLFATRKRRRIALAIVTLLGVLMLLGAEMVATWRSPQVSYYNAGIAALEQGDMETALKAFDVSLESYRRQKDRNALEQALLPDPSLEVAALAHKNRALIFIMMQKPDQAVLAFKESLKLNPGDATVRGMANESKLTEDAFVVKYDLELLFKKNPEQAKGQGKGKPQDGQGKEPQQAPGNDPGKLPGKGNKDDL